MHREDVEADERLKIVGIRRPSARAIWDEGGPVGGDPWTIGLEAVDVRGACVPVVMAGAAHTIECNVFEVAQAMGTGRKSGGT